MIQRMLAIWFSGSSGFSKTSLNVWNFMDYTAKKDNSTMYFLLYV